MIIMNNVWLEWSHQQQNSSLNHEVSTNLGQSWELEVKLCPSVQSQIDCCCHAHSYVKKKSSDFIFLVWFCCYNIDQCSIQLHVKWKLRDLKRPQTLSSPSLYSPGPLVGFGKLFSKIHLLFYSLFPNFHPIILPLFSNSTMQPQQKLVAKAQPLAIVSMSSHYIELLRLDQLWLKQVN